MSKIFELIAAVRAGQIWTAIRLAVEILAEYKDYLPKDGTPVMMATPDRPLDDAIAALELEANQPVMSAGAVAAFPWALLMPLVLEIVKKLLNR